MNTREVFIFNELPISPGLLNRNLKYKRYMYLIWIFFTISVTLIMVGWFLCSVFEKTAYSPSSWNGIVLLVTSSRFWLRLWYISCKVQHTNNFVVHMVRQFASLYISPNFLYPNIRYLIGRQETILDC